jgi:hypothetical protein
VATAASVRCLHPARATAAARLRASTPEDRFADPVQKIGNKGMQTPESALSLSGVLYAFYLLFRHPTTINQ